MRMYSKLKVFDLDGTLLTTPIDTPQNRNKWFEHYKTEWPYIGWWGRIESMDENVWDIKPIDNVVDDYNKAVNDPENLVVMITGRLHKLSEKVMFFLRKYNLVFDHYLFNKGGETSRDKIKQLSVILKDNPTIKHVEMWDDRKEHIPVFTEWLTGLVNEGVIDDFNINIVESENHK